ncbi:MAG: hypothetical protein WD359_10125 [Dehalococcoidia bacterium]
MEQEGPLAGLTPRGAAVYFVLAAATLILAFALRYPSFFEPRWYGDEGIFAGIAQNMLDGRTLYAEAWDNKPPLIFATYALIQLVSGTTGVMPLHIATAMVVIMTQAAVMAIALRLYGPWRSLIASAAFALVLCTPVLEGNLALTETYMILPATLGVLLFVLADGRSEGRRVSWYAAAGVMMSFAISYKQVAVFDAAAVGAMLWLTQERPLRALVAFGAGVATPQALLLALFTAVGALDEYVYAMAGAQNVYWDLSDDKGPLMRVAGYLPALIVGAYLVRRQRLGGDVGVAHLPMLWFAFAIAGATASPFTFPHYLQQVAPAAVLLAVSSPLPVERDDLGRIALVVTGLLVAAILYAQFWDDLRNRRHLDVDWYYQTFASYRWGDMDEDAYIYEFDGRAITVADIARYIEQDGAGNTLFTWSELSWVYAASGATNPTRYYASFFGHVMPGARDEILRDVQASPPVYMVTSDGAYAPFDALDEFISRRYELLRAQGDWRLYRLSTASGRLTPQPAAGMVHN